METSIQYNRFKGMMFVQSRDFVFVSQKLKYPNGKIIVGASTVEHPKCPPIKTSVRAEIEIAGWIFEPQDKGSWVTYITQTDLKGSIPQSIVNTATKDQGFLVYKIRKALASHYKGK